MSQRSKLGFPRLLSEAQRALGAGRFSEAEHLLMQVRRTAPEEPRAAYLLGLLRHQQGTYQEALALLRMAMPHLQNDAVALFNHATVLLEQEDYDQAMAPLRRALYLKPEFDDAAVQLGVVLAKSGETKQAAEIFQALLDRNPTHVIARMNLAGLLMDARPAAALTHAQQAVDAAPENGRATALNLKAKALFMLGRNDDADATYDEVLRRDSDDIHARFGKAILLPSVYVDEQDIERWRNRYRRKMQDFANSLNLGGAERIAAAADAVFSLNNFALPQQGRNDRTDQTLYGTLLHRIATARYPDYASIPRRPPSRKRPRIGFVSAHFHQHSIAKTHGAWLTGLDAERFEVFAVHTGSVCDATTQELEHGCEHFLRHPRIDQTLLKVLRSLELDVLIYPDLGMEPGMLLPAALRLAPVQCQGLGHPVTSGLPTIDWAISSALMEPPDARSHYTERLELLSNLSFCYSWRRIQRDLGDTSLPAVRRKGVVYLCTQNLGKLLPQHDGVFMRILGAVPDSELWFLARPEAAPTERFRARLLGQCQRSGIAPDRIIIHERLDQSRFLALNAAADVYLDGIAWSGNNTTFESLAMGLPVVTCYGEFMRARHSAAMLTMMELHDTLASDQDQYVEIAVRLGLDEGWRSTVTEMTRVRRAVIYDDETPIRDLEAFLARVTQRSSAESADENRRDN